jgi:predicted dehydrogenase
MKIAFVGCGYVFDIYMRTYWAHPELEICGVFDIDTARAKVVGDYYKLRIYPDYASLLNDPDVELVVNLTSIDAHYVTTKAALEAGKHVYSEKPLTTDLDEARELFALAAAKGVELSGAPCNLFSDSVGTMWKAIRDGAIGKPLLVYAELDDNPIYLMNIETWRSSTGAPWPYVHEYEEGCTFEHVGYHLVWMCAMFGPAVSVTAFSSALVKEKTKTPLERPDTPDFSVGCIHFANGVAARVTCSIVAPNDHRLRVIGDEGEINADSYRLYQSPVMLERFSSVSLNARKARIVRLQPLVGRLFGVGGQRLKLTRHWKSHAVEAEPGAGRRSFKQKILAAVRRRQVYAQDKLIGVNQMARALREGARMPMPADFMLHLVELTLLIQNAGTGGTATDLTTTFEPLLPMAEILNDPRNYRTAYRPNFIERRLGRTVDDLHKH